MAKKKKSLDTDDLFAQIAEETDGDILDQLDSVKFHIDTGNLAFNYGCSGKFLHGGIPGEKMTEIYGPSSSGKSIIGNNILFGTQKLDGWACILDCENATNKEFMERASHINPKRVIRHTPYTLEETFLKIYNVCRKIRTTENENGLERKPIIFVYDSISVCPCERELRETELPDDYKPSDWKKIVGRKEQPGERAKICSRELRKLNAKLESLGATLVVINQIRNKIGVLYGSPETPASGGMALPFYCSLRIRTQQKKKIENKILETYAGINMHMKNVKNKTFRPFVEAEDIKLYFDTGIDPVSGLLKSLLQAERVAMKSAGNFFVREKYLPEGLTEYKFKASKTNNEMPLEVILDCPSIVDGRSRKEIEEYLDAFGAAMMSSGSDEFREKNVMIDVDGNPIEMEDDLYDLAGNEE